MTDAFKRAARTFLQAFVGTLSVLAIPVLTDIIQAISSAEPYELNFAFWQGVVIAAALSGFIALLSWVQNALEANGAVKPILKDEQPVRKS